MRPGPIALSLIALVAHIAAQWAGRAARAAARDEVLVDETAVRYSSPETGGPGRPRFLSQRVLAFEARIDAAEEGTATGGPYLERNVRAAMERRIADGILARLPLDHPVDDAALDKIASRLRAGVGERVEGGEKAIEAARIAEGLDPSEVTALFRERARAALSLERIFPGTLEPGEEVLRESYRTASHPYKSGTYDAVRRRLSRWVVEGRLRAAEGAYFQSARTRVRVTFIR